VESTIIMADLLNLPPTRSTLLQLKQELEQIRRGYELLERKREVLARELLLLIHDAEQAEAEARTTFGAAYDALTEARMRMGADRLHWASLAPTAKMKARVAPRSVMGVIVPLVTLDITPLPLPYGLGDTSAALDEARERWVDVAQVLERLAETTTTVWRLSTELQKTMRRVNALEHVLIPQYEHTVHHISSTLEEQEREAFVRAKSVKTLLTNSATNQLQSGDSHLEEEHD
jgi:V/A-type H+-transporting ATPase subunit D